MKQIALAVLATVMVSVAACGNGGLPAPSIGGADATPAPAASQVATPAPASGALVGIALPTDTSDRWVAGGAGLVEALEGLGYRTDLKYAEDGVATQVSQLEEMITAGARVLVIAAVDGTSLADTLREAADAGITVLAYDRPILGSRDVDYYATFDSFQVGVLQARSIIETLRLDEATGQFAIELFAGPADDRDAGRLFDGAMSILQPYVDRDTLVVRSTETAFPDQVATIHWSGGSAQARMDNLLATFYADGRVDAILSPTDAMSAGIVASLEEAGYYSEGKPGPVVTGRNAELPSVKSILSGGQTSTVFRDPRALSARAATMVDQVLRGGSVDVNDTRTYANGAKVVPAFLLDGVTVTSQNAQQVLVDSGYYAADQLK